ncbi:MAG: HD domain-containing protein, partial [Blautia sp.]|nr:HD domain-containing protein [Blautia sp.]
ELVKLLVSPHPDYLRTAYEAGITRIFFPEWDACMETPQNTPHHCYSVGEHILHSLQNIRPDRTLRLTMLLHDIAKPVVRTTDETGRDHFKMHGPVGERMAKEILQRLKFDNDTITKVCHLIRWHDDRPNPDKRSVRRAVNRIGEDMFPLYLEIRRADTLAQSEYKRKEKLEMIDGVERCYQEILEAKDCVSLRTLAVSGKDLIAAGYRPGKELGSTLQRLLEHVLEHPEDNQKEILLRLI